MESILCSKYLQANNNNIVPYFHAWNIGISSTKKGMVQEELSPFFILFALFSCYLTLTELKEIVHFDIFECLTRNIECTYL